jgi:hypothetical protein
MRDGVAAFFVMSDFGGPPERITGPLHGLIESHSPAVWSPDGKQIAFAVLEP